MRAQTLGLFLAGTVVTVLAVRNSEARSAEKARRQTYNNDDEPWLHTDRYDCKPPPGVSADLVNTLGFVWLSNLSAKRTPNGFAEFICKPELWGYLERNVPRDQWGKAGSAAGTMKASEQAKRDGHLDIASFLADLAYVLAQGNGAQEEPTPEPGPPEVEEPAPQPTDPGPLLPNYPPPGPLQVATAQHLLDQLPEPYRSQILAVIDAGGPHMLGNLETAALNLDQFNDPTADQLASLIRQLKASLERNPHQPIE